MTSFGPCPTCLKARALETSPAIRIGVGSLGTPNESTTAGTEETARLQYMLSVGDDSSVAKVRFCEILEILQAFKPFGQEFPIRADVHDYAGNEHHTRERPQTGHAAWDCLQRIELRQASVVDSHSVTQGCWPLAGNTVDGQERSSCSHAEQPWLVNHAKVPATLRPLILCVHTTRLCYHSHCLSIAVLFASSSVRHYSGKVLYFTGRSAV